MRPERSHELTKRTYRTAAEKYCQDEGQRRQEQCHWRDSRVRRPGIGIGPLASSTLFHTRLPTLSASATSAASSMVNILLSRMTNSPSTIDDSMSEGWPL